MLLNSFKRLCLRLCLGANDYEYMVRTLCQDPRAPKARLIDIVVRKDGLERRVEADWLKKLARLVEGCAEPVEQP